MLNPSREPLQCHGNRWRHAGPPWIGGSAGSLVFTARPTGTKAHVGCYGNRLIICREEVVSNPFPPTPPSLLRKSAELQEIRLTMLKSWPYGRWPVWVSFFVCVLKTIIMKVCVLAKLSRCTECARECDGDGSRKLMAFFTISLILDIISHKVCTNATIAQLSLTDTVIMHNYNVCILYMYIMYIMP